MSRSPTLTIADPVLEAFAADVGPTDPVAVAGGRTRWGLGGELTAGTRVLSAPTGIVEHVPEEMIVRVRAGTTVAELDAALAERGQRAALPDRGGTVGGAMVVGENHCEVLGRGPLRASVLQVRYVSAEGRLVTGGGPTVKNVTGYDLPRLIVGSLGTLGLVAEVILRTNPVPAVRRWIRAVAVDPFRVRDALLHPAAVLWDATATWVLLEGHRADVAAQRTALGPLGDFDDVEGPPPLPEHRWSLRSSDLRSVPSDAGEFVASIGVGTMWASCRQPARSVDPGAAAVTARITANFDPTGRLNPGRDPARQDRP
jgi:glycolate oxidase FAD binding subunit